MQPTGLPHPSAYQPLQYPQLQVGDQHSVRREVVSMAIKPGVRACLLSQGLRSTADLAGYTAQQLAQVAGISLLDAQEVLKQCGSAAAQGTAPDLPAAASSSKPWEASLRPASEVYGSQPRPRHIITFSSDMDKVLGGGVACGQVTEFCGVPGVGKTQLGIQLAVNAQIPSCFGGLEGSAVYIDTEGSLMPERVNDIAAAAVKHIGVVIRNSARTRSAEEVNRLRTEAEKFTVDSILEGIYHFRVHDATEQIAVVLSLDTLLARNPRVKLVVLDSVTFHFRQDFRDMGTRARVLMNMAQECMRVAEKHGVAVVYMNQVTTRVEDGKSKIVPALGESWGHAASTRVILHWRGGDRHAFVHKSPHMPPQVAHYVVTHEGVRGPKAARQSANQQSQQQQPQQLPPPRQVGVQQQQQQQQQHHLQHARLQQQQQYSRTVSGPSPTPQPQQHGVPAQGQLQVPVQQHQQWPLPVVQEPMMQPAHPELGQPVHHQHLAQHPAPYHLPPQHQLEQQQQQHQCRFEPSQLPPNQHAEHQQQHFHYGPSQLPPQQQPPNSSYSQQPPAQSLPSQQHRQRHNLQPHTPSPPPHWQANPASMQPYSTQSQQQPLHHQPTGMPRAGRGAATDAQHHWQQHQHGTQQHEWHQAHPSQAATGAGARQDQQQWLQNTALLQGHTYDNGPP